MADSRQPGNSFQRGRNSSSLIFACLYLPVPIFLSPCCGDVRGEGQRQGNVDRKMEQEDTIRSICLGVERLLRCDSSMKNVISLVIVLLLWHVTLASAAELRSPTFRAIEIDSKIEIGYG